MGSHKCPPDLGDPDQGMPLNPGVYEQSPLCQGLSGDSCFLFVKSNVESTQKEPQETRESAQQGEWRALVLLVQSSHSVLSDSLRPHGLQHTRLPRPSPTPRACSNSCPSSQWYHPTMSSSFVPFSSCLQSFPASGSFQMSQFFPSGGQSIGVSASASVLPMTIQYWFPLGWTGWISLQSKGLLRVFSNTTVQSINSLAFSFLYSSVY